MCLSVYKELEQMNKLRESRINTKYRLFILHWYQTKVQTLKKKGFDKFQVKNQLSKLLILTTSFNKAIVNQFKAKRTFFQVFNINNIFIIYLKIYNKKEVKSKREANK